MLLKKTIHKTKNFFNKTLQHFKTFIFGKYKKLTRAPSLSLFSTNPKMQQLDNFYKEFCEQWDPDGNNANQNIKAFEKGDIESNGSVINSEQRVLNNNKATRTIQDQKSVVISGLDEEEEASCSKCVDGGSQSHVLEQKMKELEMMDMKDEGHVLDIQEVLHYYSRLTSPIYQNLVDKFFTDMYSEFQLPQQPLIRSNIMNSSRRRQGPLDI